MLYNVNDGNKLSTKNLFLFSFQMVLSVFVATVLIANICGVAVSGALVGAGVSTLIYHFITKGKSPMFLSNSGIFVAPVLAAMAVGGYTAVAIGGLVTALVYIIFGFVCFKLTPEKLEKILPAPLVGAITAVIGLNLMGFIPTYVQVNGAINGWGISVAFVTMFTIAFISHRAQGIFKILPFLIGVIVGYVYAIILTLLGVSNIVSFDSFHNLSLFSLPDLAFSHWQTVSISSLIPILILYLAYSASAVCECISDHIALGSVIDEKDAKEFKWHKIMCAEGLANISGTCLGGLGICSYGESVACIGFSQVAASRVTAVAAGILIFLGFFNPLQAVIASIPSCVFGGAAMILYGYIACSGIRLLQKVDFNQPSTLILVSVVLSLGVSGLQIGNETISFSGTALALVAGIILNLIFLKKNGIIKLEEKGGK